VLAGVVGDWHAHKLQMGIQVQDSALEVTMAIPNKIGNSFLA
jgi:hypothetical protein